jgi:hypothetical protein
MNRVDKDTHPRFGGTAASAPKHKAILKVGLNLQVDSPPTYQALPSRSRALDEGPELQPRRLEMAQLKADERIFS